MEEDWEPVATPAVSIEVVLTNCVQELCTDSYALPFGHNDQARCPICLGHKERSNSQVAHRLTIDNTDKILCGHRVPAGLNSNVA
jgi:hypothetical protein